MSLLFISVACDLELDLAMKIRRSVALKIALSSLLISLYSVGAIVGLALMCLSAWQYAGYALNPNFYVLAYGPDIRLVLSLLLTSSLLLIALSGLGILAGVLFLFVQPRRWQLLLGLLATGLILCVTMEAIAVTVQIEQWEEQLPVVPGILENRTRYASFAPDDWFGQQLSWFQDSFGCCGYNNGDDYTSGPAANYSLAEAMLASPPVPLLPDPVTWRPRSCCDDFTVFEYECTETVASYNGRDIIPGEGCGAIWVSYLDSVQWALVGVAKAAGVFQFLAVLLPLWLLVAQLSYALKERDLGKDEEEEELAK